MKTLFSEINLQKYFMIIFFVGSISFVWLLLLPSDPKFAWVFGFSKNRIVMLGGTGVAIILIGFLCLKMFFDQTWRQIFSQKIDKILNRELFWVIVLTLSSLGFVAGISILSMAFGLTDIYVQSLFLRLAPWAFLVTVTSGLNMLYFWHGDFDREKNSLFKLDIKMWEKRYQINQPVLLVIFFFPILYIVFYFALWRLQSDHSLALLFMGENHPIELATFLALFLGGIQGLKLSWLARGRGNAIWVWGFFAIFSLGIIFVAMEEIAWGQQFFDIKTPLGMKEINLQNEITFHNIDSVQNSLGSFIRLFGWGGFFGILLTYSKRFQIIGTPPILILWFLMILVLTYLSRFISSIVPMGNDYVIVDVLSETVEMFIGLASYLYFWLQTRLLSYGKLRKAFAQKVIITQEMLSLDLTDGRSLAAPLSWIPRLVSASEAERSMCILMDGGLTIHWPDLEIKIRVEQLLSGLPEIEDRFLLDHWFKK